MKFSVIVAVLLAICAPVFAQHPVIDQEQPAINNTGNPLAIGGTYAQQLAQTFTASRTGFITNLTMPLACDPAATIVVSIENVAPAGEPGGLVLGSERIPGWTYPFYLPPYSVLPAAGMRLVSFFPPVAIQAQTQYAIVLQAPVGSCSILPSPGGDLYAGGHAYSQDVINGPRWVPFTPANAYDDLAFQTFVSAAPLPAFRRPAH